MTGSRNRSSTKVDIGLSYRGPQWKEFKEWAEKFTKILVVENLVFVRGGAVVEYNDISEYLNEFRIHREGIILNKMKYDLKVLDFELEFLEAKLKFLKFMLAKKRKDSEIKKWISPYKKEIGRRLEAIRLVELNHENLIQTEKDIADIKKEIIAIKKKIETQLKFYNSLSKKSSWKAVPITEKSLFEEEVSSVDGIEVWKGDSDSSEDDEEQETKEEN